MLRLLDRTWFLTWTTYGTWLPGDRRGFVSPVTEKDGDWVTHNQPGDPYAVNRPNLQESARIRMKEKSVWLSRTQATTVCGQFRETSTHRGWLLVVASVMPSHVHLIVSVPGDPEPADLLRDFKAYASRRLSQENSHDGRMRWWTESGSKRKLASEGAVRSRVNYVVHQSNRLAAWIHPDVPNDWYDRKSEPID